MERSVGGIRETFYLDLIDDYEERQMQSTLYRFFWRESMERLLRENLPRLLSKEPDPAESLSEMLEQDFPDFLTVELLPKNSPQVLKQLSGAMQRRRTEARGLLLRSPAEKKRRDFWEELWLNDAGFKAKLITEEAYLLWLIEYLAAHGIYYKENIKGAGKDGEPLNGHRWLLPLLRESPPRLDKKTGEPMAPGWKRLEKDGRLVFAAAQVEKDLRSMAAMLQEKPEAERMEILGRLRGIKIPLRAADGRELTAYYLPWLSGQLKRMALHITIKNWLQFSGYPLLVYGEPEKASRKKEKSRERKSDFSMRLFETFCDSPEGYDFHRKNPDGRTGWHMDENGFCLLAPEQIDSLVKSLTQSKKAFFYLPLAVDLYSGCTFFAAGKENYEEVYEIAGQEARKAYQRAKETFCFDYLRVEPYPVNMAGAFQLSPAFHKNAGKSYQTVLNDFKRYCMREKGALRQTLQRLNEDEPAGIPAPFSSAFE